MSNRLVVLFALMIVFVGPLTAGTPAEEGARKEIAGFLDANVSLAQNGSAPSAQVGPSDGSALRYKIRPGDVLEINFAFTPELNQTAAIQPDGYISLNQVGSVQTAGQTIPEVTETIKAAYDKILHDPAITIGLKDFERPFFIVGGWLNRPGKYELRTPLTVLQAIAMAGGFSDSSKHSQVFLFRRSSNKWIETLTLDAKKMLKEPNLQPDLMVQPGDMIYVPQNFVSKIRRYIPIPSVGIGFYPAVAF
jgi:polysaccharide export outer membrane protein